MFNNIFTQIGEERNQHGKNIQKSIVIRTGPIDLSASTSVKWKSSVLWLSISSNFSLPLVISKLFSCKAQQKIFLYTWNTWNACLNAIFKYTWAIAHMTSGLIIIHDEF